MTKQKRAGARGWLSRAVKQLIELVDVGEACDELALEEAIAEFNKRLDLLDQAQAAVEAELEEGQLEKDIDEAADIREDGIRHRQAAVKLLMSLSQRGKKSGEAEAHEDDRLSNAGSTASADLSSVRLPKLELPRFDGTITKWQQFWDNFSAVVDSTDLADIRKFTYLQSLLDGEASRTIAGLALTSKNYPVACKLLKERFGRRERIVFAHLQGLLSMGVGGQERSAPTYELRKLQEELLTHIRSLEVYNIQGENYGVVLTPVILSRLPADIRLEWARTGEGMEDDLQFLLCFLKQEIERRERSEAFKSLTPQSGSNRNSSVPSSSSSGSGNNKNNVSKNEKRKDARTPTASALQSTSVSVLCGFCGKGHESGSCPEICKLDHPARRSKISEAHLCFRCLKKGHIARGCMARCSGCQGTHHLICCFGGDKNVRANSGTSVTMTSTELRPSQSSRTKVVAGSKTVMLLCPSKREASYTILQTARVLVCGEKTVEATLLFDSGSDRTYVTADLAKRAKLKYVSSVSIAYAPFGGGKSVNKLRNIYELRAKGMFGGNKDFKILNATEVPVICTPLRRPSIPGKLVQSMPKVEFADDYKREGPLKIDLLVGLDQYWHLVKQGMIRVAEGTVAQETEFGWILSGSYGGSQVGAESFQLLSLGDISDDVLRMFWDLESIGIGPQENVVEADHCLLEFESTVRKSRGRYEVALPWKAQHPVLLNNEGLARKRLGSLQRKLDRDPKLKLRYNEVFHDLERTGVIEEVTEENVPYDVFYLPHRPVVKESSTTTKVRPVFDASAHGVNGVSLNDCLESGPSLVPCLPEVLLRFRRWRFALTADISKAFLQISLRREDRDVHRFLWDDGGVERRMRFLRVTFGVTSSPFLLNATIRHHLATFPPSRVIEEMGCNLYVDDWLSGADSEKEAVDMLSEAQSIMAQAGMNLAKWNSNSRLVCDEVGSLGGTDHAKILGVVWIPEKDCFTFEGVELPEDVVPSKRVVLSFIARLFDPLGFLTPYVMLAKVLFQELWVLGLQWDEELPPALVDLFQIWLLGLSVLKDWEISRQYARLPWKFVLSFGVHLHAFGDASEKGYGAAVYLCVRSPDGEFTSSLVTSKAKVAPLKKVTLPRLELLGSLLAARLLRFVQRALQLDESVEYTCWTDSTVALAWIRGDASRWKQFVANRVREIQDLTDPSHWRHCPGKDNPADLTTRGILAENLIESDLWLKGPDWLDSLPSVPCENLDDLDEVRVEEQVLLVGPSYTVEEIYEYKRSSSFSKVLRVVGWVRRFVHNARNKERRLGDLSYAELSDSKVEVFRNVQRMAFSAEIKSIEKSEVLQRGSSLKKLDPFMGEDGLLRVQGRIQLSDLSYEEKHPVILPAGHVSKLIARHQHLFLKHAGVNAVIASLRASYWIVSLRRIVKGVKRECFNCQRLDSRACSQPLAPLPKLRVTEAPPFTVTGVDYTGHLFCSDFPGKKFYVCLFTCAVVRAVHLELTDSMTTADFLLALRRFAARRGLPSVVYSDNAQTFLGAETQLSAFFGHLSPKWKRIAPRAPWWGGFWERLVGSVKDALKKTIGSRRLTRGELETTLHEIEGCINSRPLCFVGDEIDSAGPLTPSHFLLGRGASFQAKVLEDVEEVSPLALSEREQVRSRMLDHFWEVWRTQYLVSLPAVRHRSKSRGELRVGSVVLIQEDHTPRMQWNLGVVLELYPGRDSIVRSVKLHTTSGSRVRAIQRLYDLEVVSDDPSFPPGHNKVQPPQKLDEGSEPVEEPPSTCNSKPDPPPVLRTKSGRLSKPTQKLNL